MEQMPDPPNTTSSLAVITDEDEPQLLLYQTIRIPYFQVIPPEGRLIRLTSDCPKRFGIMAEPSNGSWPSEAWSGIDFYTNKVIPGWKNSLMFAD